MQLDLICIIYCEGGIWSQPISHGSVNYNYQ